MYSTQAAAVMMPSSDEIEYRSLLDRLKEVERKYKIGDVDNKLQLADLRDVRWTFEQELDQLEIEVKRHAERLLATNASWYYKFFAIQAEAKDYFDTSTAAYRFDLYLLAQQLYLQLPKRVPDQSDSDQDKRERVKLKNMIRVIVAGLDYPYSIGDFGTALDYAHELRDFVVNRGLVTQEDPANGTLAVIDYFLGRTYRQRGIDDDYQRAIEFFYQSSESYFQMARSSTRDVDVIYARTRALVSLAFGAGFLFYNAQSDLVRAKALISQARLAFIKDDGDICCKLHYNYLELLYASILRAEAGEVPAQTGDGRLSVESIQTQEKLNRALETVTRCENALRHKPKYYIHTLYNKALILLYQGNASYDDARQCITELLQRSSDSSRWQANGLILKSHLERRLGQFDVALNDAIKAYNQAGNHWPVRIEALLARGQAQLSRRQLTAAHADFKKALELNNGANLKLTAMALLLLVEVGIAQRSPSQVRARFAEVKQIIPSIRHGFVLNKFRELEERINGLQSDFVIPAATDELDYKKHDAALQAWLLERVLREDDNLTRAAKRLNISKRTIYLWLAKHKIRV